MNEKENQIAKKFILMHSDNDPYCSSIIPNILHKNLEQS